MSKNRVWFFAILFVYAVICRLMPYALALGGMSIDPSTTWYPWNFSPLMALALFSGGCAAERRWGFAIPLGVLLVSDFGIWALTGNREFAFPASQPLIYGCFAAAAGLGLLLRDRPQIATAVPLAIVAEALLFLVTNFAVWGMGEGATYPRTAAGLGLCYAMGLPFFGRSLVSTSLYTVALFSPSGLRLAGCVPARAERAAAEAQG